MKVVSSPSAMAVKGRQGSKKPKSAMAIKIKRPKKSQPVKKGGKGLGNYVLDSMELE